MNILDGVGDREISDYLEACDDAFREGVLKRMEGCPDGTRQFADDLLDMEAEIRKEAPEFAERDVADAREISLAMPEGTTAQDVLVMATPAGHETWRGIIRSMPDLANASGFAAHAARSVKDGCPFSLLAARAMPFVDASMRTAFLEVFRERLPHVLRRMTDEAATNLETTALGIAHRNHGLMESVFSALGSRRTEQDPMMRLVARRDTYDGILESFRKGFRDRQETLIGRLGTIDLEIGLGQGMSAPASVPVSAYEGVPPFPR